MIPPGAAETKPSTFQLSPSIKALFSSTSPKLLGIAKLLRNCAEKAKVVIKGSDSQRNFNLQFSEFCRTAVVGVCDIQREMNCDGSSPKAGPMASVHEVVLSESAFLSDAAAYISHQSNYKLAKEYLEHLGKSSIAQNEATKRNVLEKNSTTARLKRARPQDKFDAPPARQQQSGGISTPNLAPSAAPTASSPSLHHRVQQGDNVGMSPLAKNGTQHESRLSLNSLYAPLVMPWTIPQPYNHGIAVDRVVVEKASTPVPSSVDDVPTILAIHSAANPADMLRMWEEREAQLSNVGSSTQGFHSPSQKSMSSSSLLPTRNATMESPMVNPSPTGAEVGKALTFFPRKDLDQYVDAAPHSFLVQLVHYGVSTVEFKKSHAH